ncbi:MAG: hypothetical protein ACK5YR_23315 [Pirellula sp.]|jgi:hypothetical protein
MKVEVVLTTWVSMKKEIVLKIRRYSKKRLCLGCDKPISPEEKIVRGCHERCARATYRAIEKGLTTDSERVADGKWLAHAKRGPKPSNPVTIETRQALAGS